MVRLHNALGAPASCRLVGEAHERSGTSSPAGWKPAPQHDAEHEVRHQLIAEGEDDRPQVEQKLHRQRRLIRQGGARVGFLEPARFMLYASAMAARTVPWGGW